MKNTIIATTALVAGAALVTYYFKKRKAAREMHEPAAQRPAHHLTRAFARAKNHAMEL